MGPRFQDRFDAGRFLAQRLRAYAKDPTLLVLALPRGGIPVGFEVARALAAPLAPFMVRKLGVPGQDELAMGAIASGGTRFLDADLIARLKIPPAAVEAVTKREEGELARREAAYQGALATPDPRGRRVILVDDGLATGATMRVAVTALRAKGPALICAAVPVGAREACESLRGHADDVVCAETPERFFALGTWYSNFVQITDGEVQSLLRCARLEFGA